MADATRPLSLLPTIKCSSCGAEIEIAKMAEHVCPPASSTDSKPDTSKQERQESTKGAPDRAPAPNVGLSLKASGFLRPSKTPPPRIDSTAANKPFLSLDQLTPRSNISDPQCYSPAPLTPSSGKRSPSRSPRPQFNRSATHPTPRPYSPPSPSLSSNLDCAFPPFPNPDDHLPANKQTAQISGGHLYAEPDCLYAPLSPRMDGGDNVMKRMNTIAPGPFDTKSRGRRLSKRRESNATRSVLHKRTPTSSGSAQSDRSGKDHSAKPSVSESDRSRESTQLSTIRSGSELPSRGGNLTRGTPPPRPARPAEDVDTFLEQLQLQGRGAVIEPFTADNRSKTFPIRKGSGDSAEPAPYGLPRRPSEPVAQHPREPPGGTKRSESRKYVGAKKIIEGSFPMSENRDGSRTDPRHTGAPPVPIAPNLQRDIIGNSLHAPSDSGSSDGSALSPFDARSASSRSSPPTSVSSGPSRRPSKSQQASSSTKTESPRAISSASQESAKPAPPLASTTPVRPSPHDTQYQGIGFSRPSVPEPLAPLRNSVILDGPESPMDPAIQRGLFSQRQPSVIKTQATEPPAVPPDKDKPGGSSDTSGKRRRPAGNKGSCRGCSMPIIGKSIKAADGRLTGRYHKQCFVCKTCRSPFMTADFYVLNNFPYCAHHYHQLNHSLCARCDNGIEGQYLETDHNRKYHPHCFTCSHCRTVLEHDYFEVGGRCFCERHAHSAFQASPLLGPGRKHPERRTTRLLMM